MRRWTPSRASIAEKAEGRASGGRAGEAGGAGRHRAHHRQGEACGRLAQEIRRMSEQPVKGRFAPSPTGRMHAGNVFAALVAWLVAKAQGGRIVLRIEDLDAQRSKPTYADAVQRDFERLGLTWDEGPFFQHGREEAYRAAFDALLGAGAGVPLLLHAGRFARGLGPAPGRETGVPGHVSPPFGRRARAARGGWACARPAAPRARLRRFLPCATWCRETTGRTSRGNAATFWCAARTGRSPTSWRWWWTTRRRA